MNTLTKFRPLFWEPVIGTGERLMAGVIVEHDKQISTHRILPDSILDNLYGKSSANTKNLLDQSLKILLGIAVESSLRNLPTVLGLIPGDLKEVQANNLREAIRISALMYSSLANLEKLDELETDDAPSQEENNRWFSTEVRLKVIETHPQLERYFNKPVPLLENGQEVKFGYLSQSLVLHFGVMNPYRQTAGVRDARARLWELARAKEYAQRDKAVLLMGVPNRDDPVLSHKLLDKIKSNLEEIEREADKENLRFFPMESVALASKKLIELAG